MIKNDGHIVLTPTGTLGYGFGAQALERGMSMGPHVIAVDAGSTDPGPHYLGAGEPLVSRISAKRELVQMIRAGRSAGIPVIVGSAGGAGCKEHVDWTLDIVREIAREERLKFRLAAIYSDVPRDRLTSALSKNEVRDFEAGYALTPEIVNETGSVVAQMGHEPIMEALDAGAEVIIAGRACDDCTIAAHPIYAGADPGLAIHMGKILECGAFSAEPFGMDVMLGFLGRDHFELEPGSEGRRASVTSVSAHSLYERENPFLQAGPGHRIDLSACSFEQVGERRVRVAGARYMEDEEYWVKLEGVRQTGYRTICVAGIRCPTMIERLDELLDQVRRETLEYFGDESLRLGYHVYGRNGVMGRLEPQSAITSQEIGLVIETIASDKALARGACHHASGGLLHLSYEGQFNTSGNLAFLYSPSELDAGPAYEFSIYHLMKVSSPTENLPDANRGPVR